MEKMGGSIPPGSLVHVRLVSPLSSATDHRDTPVRAVVSQPLFSSDHTLILPEGARLNGTITEAVPARLFARNGQLRFTFRQLELTPGATRKVEASLQGIEADSAGHLQLDAEGGAHAVTPKTNYVMPAIDVFLAATSLDLDEGRGIHGGAVGHGADYGGAGIRGGSKPGIRGRRGQPCWRIPVRSARDSPSMARVGPSILTLWRAAWTWSSPRTLPWRSALGRTTAQRRLTQATNFVSQVAKPDKIP